MKKASEYRLHAAECRALAARSVADDHRKQLVAMAGTWEALADERDRNSNGLEAPTESTPIQ